MYCKRLSLSNFRSYKKRSFSFSDKLTIIVGPNTSGKTNILEAVSMTATGKSFRANKEAEMILYNQDLAKVAVEVAKKEGKEELEIMITRGVMYGKKVATKKYLLNGVSKRMVDYVGNLKISLFWPEDLELVTDSPSTRRKYLDYVLSQTDKQYRSRLKTYQQSVRKRNKLLERIRERQARSDQLIYWDQVLIENGNYLTKLRGEYIDFINIKQLPQLQLLFSVKYQKSEISPERLAKYEREEIAAVSTLVGPHRDDFSFQISTTNEKKRDLSLYGSRGEQRLSVLWLKLSELSYIESKNGNEKPVLLLDDIFSEFDFENRKLVFDLVNNQQTIITTSDLDLIDSKKVKKAEVIKLT